MTSSQSADALPGTSCRTPRRGVASRWPVRLGLLVLALGQVAGVTATKSTVHFAQAEQALAQARAVDAETWAPYMWTRANETMKKSREEWAYADFGAAEQLALEAIELSERAAERAQENKAKGVLPGQMRELPKAVEPADLTAPPADTGAPKIPAAQRKDDTPKIPAATRPAQPADAPTETKPTPWGG